MKKGGFIMETGKNYEYGEHWGLEYPPFRSYMDSVKGSGCYYLSPQMCKEIIIAVGASGIQAPKAAKKIRRNINRIGDVVEKTIPVFGGIDRSVKISYACELVECLMKAAEMGKGIEIAIGYPKILVFKVN
jgi:hypothetical protein